MPLWNPITSGAYDVGKLWTPDLTLNLMGRDWAQFMSPFSWYLPNFTPAGNSDELVATVGVCFPDSWDGDAAYPVAARLSLTLASTFSDAAGGPWNSSCQFWCVIGGVAGAKVTASASKSTNGTVVVQTTVLWDALQGAFPVGPQSVGLWCNWDLGCDTLTLSRSFSSGLTSWYGCVIP